MSVLASTVFLIALIASYTIRDFKQLVAQVSLTQSWEQLASFTGRTCRRNGLAWQLPYEFKLLYFRCLKVGSTNQISERSHMTTVKPKALNCRSHASIAIARSCQCRRFARRFLFERLLFHFSSRTDDKQSLPRAGKPQSWKIVGITCTRLLECICNCRDVTSVYILTSRKLPGRFLEGHCIERFCVFNGKEDPVNWKLALCTDIQHCSHNSCQEWAH